MVKKNSQDDSMCKIYFFPYVCHSHIAPHACNLNKNHAALSKKKKVIN